MNKAVYEDMAGTASPLGGEYARLYDQMAKLVNGGGVDVDLQPMSLVADAFTLGSRVTIDAFEE